jgi:coenzyme PQQ precursor peptide PqqA
VAAQLQTNPTARKHVMQWIDPQFCDLRLGFEVTAYVYVR